MDQALITRIIEAALLASSQPLTLAQLQGLFPEEEPAPPGSVERALELLREACAERGVELVEVASGFRFQVKADVHGWVARLWTERRTKYTRATLETLALIAYRQPITRGEIEQVRGVAVSSNIIQALEEREWIRVVGHRDVPGKPALFGTTKGFLDYFGLKRLDELPPLSELKDIAELEPQLPLDRDGQLDGAVPAAAAMVAAQDQADADQADAEGGDTAAGTDDADAGDTDADVEANAGAAADDSGTGALQDSLETDEADAERDTEIESDADADADLHAQQSPDDAAVDQQHHGFDEAIDTEAVDAVNDQTPQHPEHGSAHEKNTQDPDDAREGDPDTAPGTRADAVNEDEDNAVATTTVAVDEADSDPEADPQRGGRSQTHE
ncbi:SMC-Scp complex subunit ScpB [Xanthomonas euvesicatoria]|uniref:SMC-Scp complex subunit ScpB n=1 Tax=Xanthomonas euvesicatoria TaxID=456327 RepID=UPI0013E0E34F|nr:SMC-Scp complex subunit ScpB [Xanthomonas euvesicatoria]MBV6807907.1 SMC-Scp complex subunit ScpB [Xanthomonas campestris pv. convolvuli]